MGRAFSTLLAKWGFNVIIHYHSSREEAEELACELRRKGVEVYTVGADLRERAGIVSLVDAVRGLTGSLSVLVNNASSFPDPGKRVAGHGLLEETWEEWESALSLNARAPFFLIQGLYSLLIERSDSCVIIFLIHQFRRYMAVGLLIRCRSVYCRQ